MDDFYDLWRFGVVAIFYYIGLALLLLVLAPYIVLRWRDMRHPRRDPQLGIKVALHGMMTAAVFGGLIGLSIVIVDQLVDDSVEFFTDETRTGLALVVTGALFATIYYIAVRAATNDARWVSTRRTYAGVRFIVESLVVMTGTGGMLIAWFSDDPGAGETQVGFAGVLMVWASAWVVEGANFLRWSKLRDAPGFSDECQFCGYQLRGSVAAGVVACPECGTRIPQEHLEAIRAAQHAMDHREAGRAGLRSGLRSGQAGPPPLDGGGAGPRP